MFILYADKSRPVVRQRGPTTSGGANVHTARFEFSPDWQKLATWALPGATLAGVPGDAEGTQPPAPHVFQLLQQVI